MSSPSDDAHVQRLVAAFPEFQAVLDEHLKEVDELLPYVFYGDVTRWYLERFRADDPRATEFAAWLEDEFAVADKSVDNLVGVEFLEGLPWPPQPDADRFASALGPSLHRELKRMQDWRPPGST